jgi:outer membrane protein assembly factor BamB
MLFASAIDPTGVRSFVQAFEIVTGGALWDLELPDAKGIYPDRGSMAISSDGILYASTLGGRVTAIDAVRGTLKWSENLHGATYGGLVVTGGLLLAPAADSISVIDRLTGKELRRLAIGRRLDTAPCSDGRTAYVAGDDGVVRAFNLSSGALTWSTDVESGFDAAPLLRDGIIFVASAGGTVYALDAATGTERWRTRATVKPISASPALSVDGLLYVPADDGSIHIIDSESGKLVRSRKLSSQPIRTAPVAAGGIMLAGCDDGNIYAIDPDYGVNQAYETTAGARIAGAGLALYGRFVAFAATNGMLYVLEAKG